MKFYGPKCRLCSSSGRCLVLLFVILFTMIVLMVEVYWQMMPTVQQPQRYLQFARPRQPQNPVTIDRNVETANKKRRNVIILTHMRSGSTFIGNVFNLHPDVFYLYEPLHDLRRVRYRNEWQFLEKQKQDAYRTEFSSLIRDSFTCSFQEKSTRDLIFARWIRGLRSYMSWRLSSPEITEEAISDACEKRKITVAKIMQTRLPREVGIQELQRVCSSDPEEFDCLIIHLVRDPRAVMSSLLEHRFFHKGDNRKQIVSEIAKGNDEADLQLIKQHGLVLCSELEDNLNFVKRMPDWFVGRYKLIRYEDVLKNVPKAVADLYEFAGLPMVDTIRKWIFDGVRPIKAHAKAFSVPMSSNGSGDHWRFEQEPAFVSSYEEHCRPVMKLLGYLPINGSEYLQHDPNRKLHTDDVPFLKSE